VRLPSGEDLVLHSKTEPKCKICMHPQRVAIERMLIDRSERRQDEQGRNINADYIIEAAQREWDFHLTLENLDTHTKRHLRYQAAKARFTRGLERMGDKQMRAAAVAQVAEELQISDLLEQILAYGKQNLEETDGAAIGPQELMKAIELKMKMQAAPAVNELNAAAARALQLDNDKKARDLAPTVDAEVLDEEEE